MRKSCASREGGRFDILLAGGQDPSKGKVFRIGHLGFVCEPRSAQRRAAIEATVGRGWTRPRERLVRGWPLLRPSWQEADTKGRRRGQCRTKNALSRHASRSPPRWLWLLSSLLGGRAAGHPRKNGEAELEARFCNNLGGPLGSGSLRRFGGPRAKLQRWRPRMGTSALSSLPTGQPDQYGRASAREISPARFPRQLKAFDAAANPGDHQQDPDPPGSRGEL